MDKELGKPVGNSILKPLIHLIAVIRPRNRQGRSFSSFLNVSVGVRTQRAPTPSSSNVNKTISSRSCRAPSLRPPRCPSVPLFPFFQSSSAGLCRLASSMSAPSSSHCHSFLLSSHMFVLENAGSICCIVLAYSLALPISLIFSLLHML